MKKIIVFVLAITILAVNISAFDITEYPSSTTVDKCGATVEAYRFVYDRAREDNLDVLPDDKLESIISIPKLVYKTETAQKINQKIVDNLIEKTDNFFLLSMFIVKKIYFRPLFVKYLMYH